MRLNHRPGKAKLLLLVGCGLLALVIGVGAGMVVSSKRAHAGSAHSRKNHGKEEKGPIETVYSLGELVVNLSDPSPLRYAKFTIALGIREKIADEELKVQEPLFKDAVINVVTKRSFVELHRKDGLKRLKREILAATANRVPKVTVSEVYFEQFAMQ
jgi:flagellar protein FliL